MKKYIDPTTVLLEGKEPSNLQELVNYASETIDNYFVKNKINDEVVYLALQVEYSDKVSNTHSSPINGSTNFSGTKINTPKSYPGYRGRCWIGFNLNKNTGKPYNPTFQMFYSSITGIHSGTGGYGLYSLDNYNVPFKHLFKYDKVKRSYLIYPLSTDTKIFIDDFPSMTQEKESKLEDLLQDKEYTPKKHFVYYFNTKYTI